MAPRGDPGSSPPYQDFYPAVLLFKFIFAALSARLAGSSSRKQLSSQNCLLECVVKTYCTTTRIFDGLFLLTCFVSIPNFERGWAFMCEKMKFNDKLMAIKFVAFVLLTQHRRAFNLGEHSLSDQKRFWRHNRFAENRFATWSRPNESIKMSEITESY